MGSYIAYLEMIFQGLPHRWQHYSGFLLIQEHPMSHPQLGSQSIRPVHPEFHLLGLLQHCHQMPQV